MRLERCTNIDCLRPYQVNEFDFGGSDSAARYAEKYTCPHCGQVQTGFGNRIVLVHALTEEQEAEFNRTYPLRERVKITRRR